MKTWNFLLGSFCCFVLISAIGVGLASDCSDEVFAQTQLGSHTRRYPNVQSKQHPKPPHFDCADEWVANGVFVLRTSDGKEVRVDLCAAAENELFILQEEKEK